ncbi:V-type ATP synthase subunit D [Lentzea aerocolonigenes]|uniref:V-type ATP synthase subunit D n=1 Tax=Lentzea aerocolonigenes TaxID=68170 RepID=UPI0004C3136D|nr:V-type ATP synthase subunit D [Lentzea aerocolonigenes]MCP2247304.1 H+-ATPase subunit D/Vma8 [Lentzea aerocolonigenes]
MTAIRIPPGRSGRSWLRRRLAGAERAAELLEQKLRALHAEQRRLEAAVGRSGAEWTARLTEARTWMLRAALVGGRRGIRLAGTAAEAEVTISWTATLGVRYPAAATCTPPDSESALPGGTAITRAAEEQRRALDAAVQHAVAVTALRRVSAEADATRQRVRVLRRHWVPRLRDALARTELELEEQERAEGVRHRWAASR